MSIVILYIWLATASNKYNTYYGWVPSGEYASIEHCEKAKTLLGFKDSLKARCASTGKPNK